MIILKCMHDLSASMLLLLHLCSEWMLLKEEVGGSALISIHGKIMELCF